MIRFTYLREEDYWLIFLSIFSVIFIATFMYAGVMWIRLLAALFGFGLLLFTMYVIRRGYSQKHAGLHALICLLASIGFALSAYVLTN